MFNADFVRRMQDLRKEEERRKVNEARSTKVTSTKVTVVEKIVESLSGRSVSVKMRIRPEKTGYRTRANGLKRKHGG